MGSACLMIGPTGIVLVLMSTVFQFPTKGFGSSGGGDTTKAVGYNLALVQVGDGGWNTHDWIFIHLAYPVTPSPCDACQQVKVSNDLLSERKHKWELLSNRAGRSNDAQLQQYVDKMESDDRAWFRETLKELRNMDDYTAEEKERRQEILDGIWDTFSEVENNVVASEALLALSQA
ncbi:hypothetical protein B0I37DRAFT_424364 [Chaetomium sp. MPI-CAGE-AT-0009]|nr:hypothetical protein B0I37DRAFT_424364 [Chaetomium sp. MPI-CAGE-AT-0009]